jgi:hypothetical protein
MYIKYFFFCLSILSFSNINDTDVILLSYPRSGNTFTRYCIEYVTKRPTFSSLTLNNKAINSSYGNTFPDLQTDFSKHRVFKTHGISKENINKYKDYGLILILRNYKEALVRHQTDPKHSHPLTIHDDLYCPSYINCINTFVNWKNKHKLVLFYEDLVDNPDYYIQNIVDFFQTDQKNATTILASFDLHKNRVIDIYNNLGSRSQTQGKASIIHSNNLTLQSKLDLDKKIIQNTPNSFIKNYLIRYFEDATFNNLDRLLNNK